MNLKDEFGIDCFKIHVNYVSDFNKRCGIKTIDYLADEYLDDYYMLRSGGVFGTIIEKEQCTRLEE
jgi:hypothetical protein